MSQKKSPKDKFEEKNKSMETVHQTDKGMMYISSPKEIDTIIAKVPKGKLITTKTIAEMLSKKHGTDFTCPMTTGIFSSMVAQKVEQELGEGKKMSEVTPYWRVIKADGQIYDKYLGMSSKQDVYLEDEGYEILPSKFKTKQPKVKDYEKFLTQET